MAYVNLLDVVYPVGSIYMSMLDTSPASFIGGDWKKIEDCFLLSTGDVVSKIAGVTGGEFTHTLSDREVPAHWHWVGGSIKDSQGVSLPYDGGRVRGYGIWNANIVGGSDTSMVFISTRYREATSWDGGSVPLGAEWGATTIQCKMNGEQYPSEEPLGKSHNNTPPYITVYMWQRTS